MINTSHPFNIRVANANGTEALTQIGEYSSNTPGRITRTDSKDDKAIHITFTAPKNGLVRLKLYSDVIDAEGPDEVQGRSVTISFDLKPAFKASSFFASCLPFAWTAPRGYQPIKLKAN